MLAAKNRERRETKRKKSEKKEKEKRKIKEKNEVESCSWWVLQYVCIYKIVAKNRERKVCFLIYLFIYLFMVLR